MVIPIDCRRVLDGALGDFSRISQRSVTEKLVVIDINAEQLISLRQVSSYLPRRPNGKKIHISAVYRWVQRGCGGKRLEAIKIGGTAYTSKEALQRFGVAQHEARPPATNSAHARTNRTERVRREVERLLYPQRSRAADS